MNKWIAELNDLGVFDWFAQIDDREKSSVIINFLAEQLLGPATDYLPSHIIEALPASFEHSDDDWYSLITQAHIDDEGNLEYVYDCYIAIRDYEPCMSEQEITDQINYWYIEWCCGCRTAFKQAISSA